MAFKQARFWTNVSYPWRYTLRMRRRPLPALLLLPLAWACSSSESATKVEGAETTPGTSDTASSETDTATTNAPPSIAPLDDVRVQVGEVRAAYDVRRYGLQATFADLPAGTKSYTVTAVEVGDDTVSETRTVLVE